MFFREGYESSFRISSSESDDYINTLKSLREEYKGRIEIRIGFEMEYYPKYFELMFESAVSAGAEYLILGEHFINNEYPDGLWCGFQTNDAAALSLYVDSVIEGMNTGVYTYIAHPDLFNFTGAEELYEREMRRLCKASILSEIPLEINLLGIRGNRHYPNPMFWRIAGEEGCSAVLGFDAHTAYDAYDEESIPKAVEIANKYNINIIEDPHIVDIRSIK